MSSAAEAELGAMFINDREAVPCRKILEEMDHKQPRTPMQIDNSTAVGVVNKNIQPRRTKEMDMRFHWLHDREDQKQFKFCWRPEKLNLADYWTEHHCASHHREKKSNFLTPRNVIGALKASFRRRLTTN